MPGSSKRTPRACERCRQTRRRCEPPHPCRSCIAANVTCSVRTKARPQRRRQHRPAAPIVQEDNRVAEDASGSIDVGAGVRSAGQRGPGDTFELLKTRLQSILLKQHEPPSCRTGGVGASVSPLAQSDASPPPPLNPLMTWHLLVSFRDFMRWQDARFVNIERLQATICAHIGGLSEISPSKIPTAVTVHQAPIDSIALIFGVLALGAVATGEFGHGRFYCSISTETVKHFVGQPTLDLCLAYFLQHVFTLRAGTSNHAHGIVAQAVQNAHELGLQHNNHGVPGLQLYLLIYMADQYCSLTRNTEPIIRTSELPHQVFLPLSNAEPQLQTLIGLITINGLVIEYTHRIPDPLPSDIIDLESQIGDLYSHRVAPTPLRPSDGDLRAAYEPLARIHMLWCRLQLRVPGLSQQTIWLSSLCICVHAAEELLATYFALYQPVLEVLARQTKPAPNVPPPLMADKSSLPITHQLAATWRQVKRIMTSALVIVFAFWHGEMVHGEASRYLAMARLLLEYPRWRWGEKLDEAVGTLLDIASLGELPLYENMRTLLPGVSEQFLGSLCSLRQEEDKPASEIHTKPPPEVLDYFSIESFSGADLYSIEHQNLFGLWENIGSTTGLSSWTNDQT